MIVRLCRTIITKCNGCGVDLQTKDIKVPGYIMHAKLTQHIECRKNYTNSIQKLLKGQISTKQLKPLKVDTVQEIDDFEENTATKQEITTHEKIIKKRNIYCQRCAQVREQSLYPGIEAEMKKLKQIDTNNAIKSIFSNVKPRSVVLYIVVRL